jgi:hypothetical protein
VIEGHADQETVWPVIAGLECGQSHAMRPMAGEPTARTGAFRFHSTRRSGQRQIGLVVALGGAEHLSYQRLPCVEADERSELLFESSALLFEVVPWMDSPSWVSARDVEADRATRVVVREWREPTAAVQDFQPRVTLETESLACPPHDRSLPRPTNSRASVNRGAPPNTPSIRDKIVRSTKVAW